MLNSYLYWFCIIEVCLIVPYILIPGTMDIKKTQTSRIITVALWLPVYGRILGWW